MTSTTADQANVHPHHRHGWWWKSLLIGFGLWVATILVTVITANTNLIPTLILLGSFLVPFCVVLFVIERVTGTVSTLQVILLFFVGGVCGVLGASLLEADLHPSLLLYAAVGLIEELVKLIILVIATRATMPKTRLQGALLGATVGAGFAAFESAGYAFNAALSSHGIALIPLLQTEVVRAILAPVGHVAWTAILGAVIFGAAKEGARLRLTGVVIVVYIGVSLLHGLWDSLSGISSILALVLTGNAIQVLRYGFLSPHAAQTVATLAAVLYIVGLVVVGLVGLLALRLAIRDRSAAPPAA
ncbi:MAG TPA: PrsW family glutamic-type intramembrane protease [Galbitalea sp.]|jgi:RsiW-degrading membrane proteinase PrsW (M82 family)